MVIMNERMRVGFIGVGAAGSTLARGLVAAGLTVEAVADQSTERAASLADELPGARVATSPQAVVDRADLVFLTVPDDVIGRVCASLEWDQGKIAVHCSGALTREVLASAASSGAQTGSCHPMQTFAGLDEPATHLDGCMFGIEAEGDLRPILVDLVERIGGWPLLLDSGDKAQYHLAGVIASNYLVTLASAGASMLESFGLNRADALRGLLPLIRGTVNNLDARGLPEALTGPVARGDIATVHHHLESLAQTNPAMLRLYIELGRQTIPIARERGGLSDEAASQLDELFTDHTS